MTSLKCATVGIDGTGKTTSLYIASKILTSKKVGTLAFLGRRPFLIEKEETHYLFKFLRLLDYLHELADKSGNKRLVLYTNLLHIYTQGRMVEPYIERFIKPSIILSPRDYLIDSTVYAGIYWKDLAEKGIEACFKKAFEICKMQPRNLVFFLTSPTALAMQRIQKRLGEHTFNKETHHRPKWAHMHEKEFELLDHLRQRYYPVLRYYNERFNTEIHEIDTSKKDEYEVGEYIANIILERFYDSASYRSKGWFSFS
jgi:thymidylate kinase